MATDRRGACFLSAIVCLCIGFAWQALTVHYNYGGNWTALFVTGSRYPPPPSLAFENLYVLQNSTGYDGQMYHYVAHDPLMRHGFAEFMDSARSRYRRILLPALAFLLAGGRQTAIDECFIGANLLFLWLGAWWLSRFLTLSGHHPAWSILFVLTPAALISLDRLTVDLVLTALCIGFAYYAKVEVPGALYAVLVLAGLSRETGLVLTAAFCIFLLARRRFMQAALFSTPVLFTGVWYMFVNARTVETDFRWHKVVPLVGIADSILHPVRYPFSLAVNTVAMALDYLLIAGILMACVLAFSTLLKNPFGYMEIAASLWALGALCLPQTFWADCVSSARVFTPLLIFLILRSAANWSFLWCLPLILVSMRIWLQLLSPLLGIVKGLIHGGR
jgi:hypothetical protein